MAKKKKQEAEKQDVDASGGRRGKVLGTRIPQIYLDKLAELQEQYRREHGFRPNQVDLIRRSLRDLFKTHGLWSPDDDAEESAQDG